MINYTTTQNDSDRSGYYVEVSRNGRKLFSDWFHGNREACLKQAEAEAVRYYGAS